MPPDGAAFTVEDFIRDAGATPEQLADLEVFRSEI